MPKIAEKWIRDVETIKVMADPRRIEILKYMAKPITVKEIASLIGLPPSKLYYHINLLEKHELIEIVDHNLETGIVEKIYEATAKQFNIVNPLVSEEKLPNDVTDALLTSMLDETKATFRRALIHRDPNEGTPPRHPFMSKKAFGLTDKQLTAFHAKLVALIEEVSAMEDASTEDDPADMYELTLVFSKSSFEQQENDHE